MITLTEKKLKEFENKFSLSINQIKEIQEQILLINKFNFDLNNSLKDISKVFKNYDFIDTETEKKFNQINSVILNFTNSIKQLQIRLDDSDTIIKHYSEILVNFKNIHSDNEIKFKELSSNIKSLINSQNIFIDQNEKLKSENNKIQDFKNIYIANNNNILEYIKNLENKINKLESENIFIKKESIKIEEKIKSIFENLDKLIDSKINKIIEAIPKQNSQETYKNQIDDVKKDISTILKLVYGSISQNPEQEKINSKMKIMENSIAQIYEMLKKYENRL